ncbi:MAG: hypothetical protein COW01_10505 [Bdellovibrionales bacterium CG12_big_fil_rev_8_21_14_0_65_38_15]|nr:MAG: hypothetical protein COW79_07350 [Bdellovibrionales bacterium CG22_combo_CG10-13_8_21_14_all_38_13]PIQ54568.1 MAG: hypothetical protein COW01_10505 [Bdellovibrionales bacterium CG12_big_fil_rev_8_21_14_0_65_38_15]PIR29949.1 MAG: hypothetical protein COV38_08350 [Bdellovibrionales bacterium CG11_big_fil_rev_8_21_14_0_20_38_13]
MTQLFIAYIIKYWIFAQSVDVSFNAKAIIPGAWQEVSKTHDHCLLFKAALKTETVSILSIVQRKNSSPCLENITSPELYSIPIKSLENISAKDGKMEISITQYEKKETFSFPLWGQKLQDKRLAYIGDVRTSNTDFLEDGEYCDENCSQCAKGIVRVVTPKGIKKICKDASSCGKRNEAACFLGVDRIKDKNYCVDGSVAGWCEQGLKISCSPELEYLVCE